jgi:hypothetical protein
LAERRFPNRFNVPSGCKAFTKPPSRFKPVWKPALRLSTISFESTLEGEIFGPLRDPAVFAQVRLDPEVQTVVWPSDADFDPTSLHDWPVHEAAFRAAAQR